MQEEVTFEWAGLRPEVKDKGAERGSLFREERRDVRRVGDIHMGGGLLCATGKEALRETWAGAGEVRSLSRRGYRLN